LVANTLTSLTVSWTAPTSNGNSDINKYILFIKAEYDSNYKEIYSGLSTIYTASLLQTGFNYQFKVMALNAAGSSAISAASNPFITALIPSTPLNLDLVSRSDTDITF
jgi:hypothetical protein